MNKVTRGAALSLMAATCALGGAGCKKEKESLVVAQLKLAAPDPRAVGLVSVSLMATPGPTRTFELKKMLSTDATVDFGVYLPGDITGNVSIIATAVPASGCVGFRGSGIAQIASAGATDSVTIAMTADNVCPPDGGTGGSGGSGSGGSGGAGGATAGTGGTTAGTGGNSTGGSTAGQGGTTAGTGGSTTGGAGGSGGSSAGRGGAGGSSGAGGSGGSSAGRGGAGAGGSGGSGGSTAGRGGTTAGAGGGGSGGTGTGGMAGYPAINGCRAFPHGALTGCPNVQVKVVAIAPNGQMVASAGDDGQVKIWSFDGRTLTATGKLLPNFLGYGLAFSPDGTRLVFTEYAVIHTYTVGTWTEGTLLAGNGNDRMEGVGFTPDGHVVSVDDKGNSGGTVYIHDINGTGTAMLTKNVTAEPWSLAVSPRAASDGSVGIAVGTYYSAIAVLKMTSGLLTDPMMLMTRRQDPTFATPVSAVRFSPDGTLVAEGEDSGAVRWWAYPITSTTPIGDNITFAGGNTIDAIAFSPNGMYLAVGGTFASPQLSIYSVATQMELARATPTPVNNIISLAFSPSGGALIAGEDGCGTILVCN